MQSAPLRVNPESSLKHYSPEAQSHSEYGHVHHRQQVARLPHLEGRVETSSHPSETTSHESFSAAQVPSTDKHIKRLEVSSAEEAERVLSGCETDPEPGILALDGKDGHVPALKVVDSIANVEPLRLADFPNGENVPINDLRERHLLVL